MEKETFDREISMCRSLNQKNGGRCNWGECAECGVIPLLYKIYKGEFLENKGEIEKVKKEIFS